MNSESWKLIENLIPKTYARQGADAIRHRENKIRIFLQHKKIPDDAWDEATIELFLQQLSLMDSNNFVGNAGLGEREGRIVSGLVARRHYNFGHGIGRSGDLTEPQPKAAGSSLIQKLTNIMLEDLFKAMSIQVPVHCLLVPVATSMSLVLSLLTLKTLRPEAKYVIWSRIDQKACFKSIITAGCIPIIIDTVQKGDQLETDLENVEAKIMELGADTIICVMSTTSCFAPRVCDNIESIAKICKRYDIPHLINNAYGLQSKILMGRMQKAQRSGRVDIFVQSTDKNLLVPVGGAIIACFDKSLMENISRTYPGRASSGPIIDVFITLLNLGKNGYLKLIEERIQMYDILLSKLNEFATEYDEHVFVTPDNPISIGLTLKSLSESSRTKLGSMLFIRNISGTRIVTAQEEKTIGKYNFKSWGSHSNNASGEYLTSAASIGITENDVNSYISKLRKLYVELYVKS